VILKCLDLKKIKKIQRKKSLFAALLRLAKLRDSTVESLAKKQGNPYRGWTGGLGFYAGDGILEIARLEVAI